MTPELIIHAIKSNPKVIVETIQKFDTFKLLGSATSSEQQIILSNNAILINDFLKSDAGRKYTFEWVEKFCEFVAAWKAKATEQTISGEIELEVLSKEQELREKIRLEIQAKLEARIRSEVEAENIEEIQNKIRADLAAKAKVK